MKTEICRNSDMLLNTVYFWTMTIVDWKHLLHQDTFKQIVIESLQYLVTKDLIKVYGFVIMPNHIHLIWGLLSMNQKEMPDSSFTKFTAHAFKKDLKSFNPLILEQFKSNKYDRKYQFWQRDPLAIKILSREMFFQKLNYVHLNPLQEKWNLADKPENYRWSSARFYDSGIDDLGILTHYLDIYWQNPRVGRQVKTPAMGKKDT